jgi:predicted PhzF superfamily epimerase YddE/YHI9
VLLEDAERLLELRPGALEGLFIGAAAPHAPDDWEVRCWFGQDALTVEDPVTGSFNAALGQWLLRTGRASAPYVARQGTALGRRGRAHISQDADGAVWVGGGTVTCVSGEVEL